MQHPHTPTHLSFPDVSPSESQLFQGLMQIAPEWADIAWVIANTHLPVILKGILHPADAQKQAVEYNILS